MTLRKTLLVLLSLTTTVAVTASAATVEAATGRASAATTYAPEVRKRTALKVKDPVSVVERKSSDAFVFVVQRQGQVLRWTKGGKKTSRVLDISSLTSTDSERGLLGLTFIGDKAYINHTNKDGDTVVAEYTVRPDGRFVASSRRVVITIDQPYSNHNGGDVVTGPDNLLYIGMGDGGSGNDPERRALNTKELLGKMLRIDPRSSGTTPYSIPKDNPLATNKNARPEIWSLGLRNPWRYSFDDDGNLWVADVGQNKWEEVSVAPAKRDAAGTVIAGGRGVNFGWPAYEGPERYKSDQQARNALRPIHSYEHGDAGCSISGGARVPRNHPQVALRGWYVFSDYCSGELTGLQLNGVKLLATHMLVGGLGNAVSVDQTSNGIFVSSLDDKIYEILAS
ncbi:MAG: PQQ-dependent sugar dehydrogenase [Actinobacteria bacterium]|nr:PQQ-dependent sugar dehydrogenase [Actinomycetota bacterium]